MFEWKRCGEVESDPGLHLHHFGAYLEDPVLQCINLSVLPFRVCQSRSCQGVQDNISRTVEEEPELVGLESVTGGAVGVEERLMVFDEEFHTTPCAIDLAVDKRRLTTLEIGHHKADVLPLI